ncbi:MAG TPA: DEAD/DEAH box helicase [Vulgatibacter sp.]|nr:DEAD/DEAH box helicase [Vulgatibacter sp.]
MDEKNLPADEEGERPSDYVAGIPFSDLPLSDELQRAIAEHGYTHPTPVQAQAIPKVLAGVDLIVRSKTGTGKTAAFSIPMIEKIPAGTRRPSALVLCPTRELAIQVADEASQLAKYKDLRVAAIYGGAPMGQQITALEEGAEIIVGTPGRVYDHIRRGTLDLSEAMFGVLDEADEMLSMGFFEEVTRILDHLPKTRQTLLFSATVPLEIERMIRKYLESPETLLLSGDVYTVEGIHHVAYKVVEDYPKPRNLLYLLELENPENAIIFANTRDDTALVAAVLNRNGYDSEMLSGELAQKERERVMAKVKRGEVRFLVATDIAARGIDISDLTHVINYSLPEEPAVYLHRVGRTGRIGKTGTAISLVGGRDYLVQATLERQFGIEFEKRTLPTAEEARKLWTERHVAELREGMGSSVFEAFLPLAQELKKRSDGDFLIAYALKYFFTQRRIEKVAAQRKADGAAEAEAVGKAPAKARAKSSKTAAKGRERKEGEKRERKGRGEKRPARKEASEPTALTPPDHVPVDPRVETPVTPPVSELEKPRSGKLWVSLGEQDGLDAAGVKAALAEASGASADDVERVEVRAAHSFAWVRPGTAEAFLVANGKARGDKELKVERARRSRR